LPDVEFSKFPWQQLSVCTITMFNTVQCQVYLNMHVLGAGCTPLLTRWLAAIIMKDSLLQFYFLVYFNSLKEKSGFTSSPCCLCACISCVVCTISHFNFWTIHQLSWNFHLNTIPSNFL
jgi:hypothetical protein